MAISGSKPSPRGRFRSFDRFRSTMPDRGRLSAKAVGTIRLIFGGFIATLVMTVILHAAARMGIMKMDVAAMLGSLVNGGVKPEAMTDPWKDGMLMHLVNGTIIFPLIYGFVLYRFFVGPSWLRGLEWGVTLWALSQAVVMPMMGYGFFSMRGDNALMVVLGSLVAHLVYGALLGAFAGRQRPPDVISAMDAPDPLGVV